MTFSWGKHIAPEVLADLYRERLDASRATRAEVHLQDCERCRGAMQRISVGLETMGELASQQAPADLSWDHIGARIYWNTSSERRARERGLPFYSHRNARRWRNGLAGVGIASAVAITLVWGLGSDRTDPVTRGVAAPVHPQDVPPAPAPTAASAARPLEAAVVFAQGAVRLGGEALDADARITAGTEFVTGEGRLVIQFGADSAFRVAPNSRLTIDRLDSERIALRVDGQVDVDITRRLPGQEFSVLAGHHEVKVRGTAFRVDYTAGELGVQCIRGKVVVSDGDHGVHVPAGQRFQVVRNALRDATLRALPMPSGELEALGEAMRMPMLPAWDSHTVISESSALIEVNTAPELAVAVDGTYVAEGSFVLRTSIGHHEVALLNEDGELGRGRLLNAGAGQRAGARLQAPVRPSALDRTLRREQLTTALVDNPRVARCLAPLTKQRLLAGSYLVFEVGINADGSQRYLNLLDSNLSPVIQECLRDVVDAQQLPQGSAASFRFRLSY